MSLRSITWSILKFISNLYFSISLFLFLACISIIGTFIEQDQSLNYYQSNYPIDKPLMFVVTWKRILWLGLDHMYSTPWFLAMLLLFFLSLIVCTISTQLPILKYSRQWNFLYSQESLNKKNIIYKFQPSSLLSLIYLLNLKNYYVFHKGKGLYAYKGLLGRIAPIFVHMSIIITFLGFILRMIGGVVVQEMVPNGELFHLQNNVTSGTFSIVSNNIVGKVEDFFIAFNDDQSIKQFFSNISFINNKKSIYSVKYIWVNSPMKFHGLTVYQTDWQINALRLQIGSDRFIVKSLKKVALNIDSKSFAWACDLVLDKSHQISIVISPMLDSLLIYDQSGQLVSSTSYGLWTLVYGIPILYKDLMVSTGLQVKLDPGLSTAYFGFFILMISIVVSYTSYSQIWVNQNRSQVCLSGTTNRANIFFEEELFVLYKKITYLLLFKH